MKKVKQIIGRIAAAKIASNFIEDANRRATLRTRIRYFRPTVTQTFFGRRVQWQLRDQPLSEEELGKLT
jgi:hypothetical protein